MSENPENENPPIKHLPSLMDLGQVARNDPSNEEMDALFYTCPQCGHPMVTKKCKIVCYTCHYFIGCVE
jgi:rubrerythrin